MTEQQRIQITEVNEQTSSLVMHEADAHGLPRCGTPLRPWQGKPMRYTRQEPGEVTCLRCKRATG
jgi:hypothetical protein